MPHAIGSILRPGLKRVLLLATFGILAPHAVALAQAGSVSGVITDSVAGRPVANALVRAAGTAMSARTNPNGQFTLTGLQGTTVDLIVTHLGYQPTTRSATVGATNLIIQLNKSVLRLDEFVVTGQAGGTEVRALGNVVGVVDMSTAQAITPSK
jgi:hypothetical protein